MIGLTSGSMGQMQPLKPGETSEGMPRGVAAVNKSGTLKGKQTQVGGLFGGGGQIGTGGGMMGGLGGMMGIIDPAKAAEMKKNFKEQESILNAMSGDRATPEQKKLIHMGLMDWKNEDLKKLKDAGVTIDVLPKDEFLALDKAQRDATGRKFESAGKYSPVSKKLILREDDLSPRVVSHEMSHALDDNKAPDTKGRSGVVGGARDMIRLAKGKELQTNYNYSSDNKEFQGLYNDYMKRTDGMKEEGGALWSNYARTDAKEYYAEGMAMYKDPFRNPTLKAADPSLYKYMQNVAGKNPAHFEQVAKFMAQANPG